MKSTQGNRWISLLACSAVVAPTLIGCGSGSSGNPTTQAGLPPIDDTRTGQMPPYGGQGQAQPRQGMSTGQKLAILGGAAALYYMYKKNQQRRAQGDMSQPQYYLSRNGRVYYRDQNGRAHWVTPPAQGIQVPWEEAQQYRQFQGFNGNQQGRDLMGLPGVNYSGGY